MHLPANPQKIILYVTTHFVQTAIDNVYRV